MLISAVVCTYNRCESLRDTMRALQEQAVSEGDALEILVVNNNSTDRTKEVVEEEARHARWPIRYLFESQQGKSHALNQAIREASGEFLVFTDDDVIPDPKWAKTLWQTAEEFHADAVGGPIFPIWIRRPPSWLLSDVLRKYLWSVLALLDRGPEVIVAKPSEVLFMGANMALRKAVFSRIGLFRTDLGRVGSNLLAGEETELLERLLKGGNGRAVYTPQAIVHHKVGPERMRMSYVRRWRFSIGRTLTRMTPPEKRRVPRWFVRECLETGCRALMAYARGNRILGIQQESVFWTQLGHVVEGGVTWRAHAPGRREPAHA